MIDEAYVDFGAETAIPLVASHPNLLVVQTMSKSRALAGLRVGYAIGDADLIEALTRVKDSFNSYPLGRPAQAGAIASLEDEAYFQQSRARVIEGRSGSTADWSGSASKCCRPPPTSSSRVIRRMRARRWPPRCANGR